MVLRAARRWRAEGFDAADAVDFWDQVNREDWDVCELTQRGMGSRAFTPGRYTTQEDDVHAFDVMVADRYLEALERRTRAMSAQRHGTRPTSTRSSSAAATTA